MRILQDAIEETLHGLPLQAATALIGKKLAAQGEKLSPRELDRLMDQIRNGSSDTFSLHRWKWWEQQGDRIFLRRVRYEIRAETTDPLAAAVRASNLAPIMRVFDVEAYGKNRAPVIEITELFTKDVPEFSANRALSAGAFDSSRTFVERVKAFPQNVEVRVLATYAAASWRDMMNWSSGTSFSASIIGLTEPPGIPKM